MRTEDLIQLAKKAGYTKEELGAEVRHAYAGYQSATMDKLDVKKLVHRFTVFDDKYQIVITKRGSLSEQLIPYSLYLAAIVCLLVSLYHDTFSNNPLLTLMFAVIGSVWYVGGLIISEIRNSP